ncbi:hypothetical protein RND81_01G132700 [Saponaria officinalis]|uniref:F-box associated beta-propeller type 3 domain-containing protein n=1 Tax=Saponaria officinalis TaxID=3572 RepID=A0AAW1NEU9_SAPOF
MGDNRMSNANKMMLKKNNTEMADLLKLGHHMTRVENKAKKRRRLVRKQREDEGHTFCLPEEILFNILLLIPAQHLHEVVRFVSKQLFDIVIDPVFVRLHRQMSTPGFLIQNRNEKYKLSYIEPDSTRLKVTEIQIPLRAKIMGSFNGLVLLHDLTNPHIYHVMNPATKVNFTLPPLTGLCDINSRDSPAGFGLTSSGCYKVVHVSAKASSKCVRIRVFTLGVDTAWRFIDLRDISIGAKVKNAWMCVPRFIAGFIYWSNCAHFDGIALDVDTEIIYQFSPPEDLVRYGTPIWFLSTGTCLALLRQCQGDIWRLWKLTCVKTGEWTEMAGINIQPVLSRVDKMFYPSKINSVWPVWLINGDFWFYRRVDEEFVVVRYNLVNESFSFFPITHVCPDTLIHPHVHTLLSTKNCKPAIKYSSIDDYNNY